MKYFFDTEFIEDGQTIDLISIGMVAEDGRTLYLQNSECKFEKAGDWVWRNVFPHLIHFDMRGRRACHPRTRITDSGLSRHEITSCGASTDPAKEQCPWATRREIRDAVLQFCDSEKFGKPEFWGYYADYDWVAFCQLFGPMIALPKGFPMYCRDIKQLCDALGNPKLPPQPMCEHHALADARWNRDAYAFLLSLKPNG